MHGFYHLSVIVWIEFDMVTIFDPEVIHAEYFISKIGQYITLCTTLPQR